MLLLAESHSRQLVAQVIVSPEEPITLPIAASIQITKESWFNVHDLQLGGQAM